MRNNRGNDERRKRDSAYHGAYHERLIHVIKFHLMLAWLYHHAREKLADAQNIGLLSINATVPT